MSYLTELIKSRMEDTALRLGRKVGRLLIDAGVVSGQYYDALAGRRGWPDSVLIALGESGFIGHTAIELFALRALEEYSSEAILLAGDFARKRERDNP